MTVLELIGVAFDGYGRDGHQADAAEALRRAGLSDAFGSAEVLDVGDVPSARRDTARGAATTLLNEPGLVDTIAALGPRVRDAVHEGRMPFVHGGDCSILLGILPALRDEGPVGLLFLDGHEDTMPLQVSEDGEAANAEIGLLLGRGDESVARALGIRLPALEPDELAVLGVRDAAWRGRFGVGSLRDDGVHLRDWREVAADPSGSGREAAAVLHERIGRWWLHVDLDVLDPEVFAAQGLPGVADDPDGLTWDALTHVLVAALTVDGCIGMSITIYDPEQDADGTDAARIVRLIADVGPTLLRS